MAILTVNGLSKRYGSAYAVNRLNLTIESGNVYGLLGPNGSGKTTTLGMLLGVTRPTSGRFQWFDGSASPARARRRIGSILERPNFYSYLTGYQNLQVTCAIRGKGGAKEINGLLDTVGLGDAANKLFSVYSLGMQQRLSLAAALVGGTDVLVLDEPTNGVDAKGIAEIRHLILDVASQGKTILLASHILDEVQKVCSHISILKAGQILTSGAIGDVLGTEDKIEVASVDMKGLLSALNDLEEVQSTEMCGDLVVAGLRPNSDLAKINARLVQVGQSPHHLARIKQSLETRFLEITGEQ